MIPLSASTIEQVFSSIRHQAIGGSQMFVKLAFTLGCLFCVIRLVKLTYNIVSDEQHGGFGGVRLWDILMPVVFLCLIQGAPLAVRTIDYTTSVVVSSISNSVSIPEADAAFKQQMDNVKNEYQQRQEEEKKAYEDAVNEDADAGRVSKWIKIVWNKIQSWVKRVFHNVSYWTGGTMIPWLAVKIYDFMTFCFQIVANIFLCLLALLFPITLCLNILDIWKGNLNAFIVKYVQVSFWKVILVCVQWVVANARLGVSTIAGSNLSFLPSSEIAGRSEALIWTSALICIAGVMCIKYIPQWAATIIGGGQGEVTGGAGGVAGAPASGAQKGASAASGAMKEGKASAAASQASAAASKRHTEILDVIGKIGKTK